MKRPKKEGSDAVLAQLRRGTDKHTRPIVQHFIERMKLAVGIGRRKKKLGEPIRDKTRERQNRTWAADEVEASGLDRRYGAALMDALMALGRRIQRADRQPRRRTKPK